MRIASVITLLASLGLLFSSAPAGTSTMPRDPSAETRRNRFSHYRGMTVENKDGQYLGRVGDFVVDLQSGSLRYALVHSRHLFGLSSIQKIVPAQALSDATAKRRTLALDISLSRWKNAPRFKKSDLATLNQPQRRQQLLAYYGLRGSETSRVPASVNAARGKSTARSPSSPKLRRTAAGLERAEKIVNSAVMDSRGEPRGTVSDLLLDLTEQRPVFVIVFSSDAPGASRHFAFALRELVPIRQGYRLNAANHEFERARPFSREAWNAFTRGDSPIVYFYPE